MLQTYFINVRDFRHIRMCFGRPRPRLYGRLNRNSRASPDPFDAGAMGAVIPTIANTRDLFPAGAASSIAVL
jgi:hypothetical protein